MATPIRRFTQLQSQHPELTDSQLLNSNNQTAFTGKADVVVAGAGILGLCYAICLKNIAPDLKIEVFEKSLAPIQKIGESTLSPFSTFTTGEIIPCDYLLQDREVTAHDIGGLDISFQLDRRMSELFLTMWAQSIGVNVYHGVAVDFEIPEGGSITSNLDEYPSFASFTTPKVILKDSSNSIGTDIDARMVCDASGFSRRLTSKFGVREMFDSGWNTRRVLDIFPRKGHQQRRRPAARVELPRHEAYLLPRGLGVVHWAHFVAPRAAGQPHGPRLPCHRQRPRPASPRKSSPAPANYPRCSCPYEFITSIGWAVRNDFKLPDDLSAYGAGEAEQKFNFFRKRYPAIDPLLTDSFELLPGYYDGRTYFVRKRLAYLSPVVAGEGWLADWQLGGLHEPSDFPRHQRGHRRSLARGQSDGGGARCPSAGGADRHDCGGRITPDVHARLHATDARPHEPDVAQCVPRPPPLRSRSEDALVGHIPHRGQPLLQGRKVQFTEADARWGIGAGFDEFQALSAEVLDVLDGTNGGASPSEVQVQKALAIMERSVRERTEMWPENHWGRWLREYDDKLQKVPGKMDRSEGCLVEAKRCEVCNYFVHNRADNCPICGEKNVWRRNE
ncbi:hypothetical protein B0H14DRAFT_3493649 [Mycena olivaceomarginata]|nr:hypothetical protein B0H14DRAFT_3493649 [Mycena olivaceomarginata]